MCSDPLTLIRKHGERRPRHWCFDLHPSSAKPLNAVVADTNFSSNSKLDDKLVPNDQKKLNRQGDRKDKIWLRPSHLSLWEKKDQFACLLHSKLLSAIITKWHVFKYWTIGSICFKKTFPQKSVKLKLAYVWGTSFNLVLS